MGTSSIQVSSDLRDRLAAYKLRGMSYEDVLDILITVVPPSVFKQHVEASRAEAASRIRNELATAARPEDAARTTREARWRAMRPIERMEEAYNVSRLAQELS